jgi:hypothetical protein
MKTLHVFVVSLLLFAFKYPGHGQNYVADNMPPFAVPENPSPAIPDASAWPSTPIDWCSSVRIFPEWITNNHTGEVTVKTHGVIAMGSGLNYIDESGTWRESEDLLEMLPDGTAAARRCPNKVFLNPLLSAATGIKIVTKSNLVFNAYPLGVFFYDPTTGKRQLLAPLQNGVKGTFVPPNRMVYPSAFHSALMDADLRITVTKGAMECDTIITRPPTVSPQTYSMEPSTTLLQVQHAWSTPAPPKLGQSFLPGGVSDTSIDFGDLTFAPGRFFDWDGGTSDTSTPAQINVVAGNDHPVAKSWQVRLDSMRQVFWRGFVQQQGGSEMGKTAGFGVPTVFGEASDSGLNRSKRREEVSSAD